ncbi:MAG TPA: LysM peptidoglycan-binding domain-containing M23 family metallopeptidase [Limnochordales bacterium]
MEQGETLWDIARLYGVSVERIAQANDLADPHRITAGQRLTIPGASAPRRPRLVVNGRLQRALQWPVRGGISSPFGRRWGRMHEGVDIRVPPGTPVRAAAGGRVVFAGWNGGYGYLVIVDHGQGVHTYYAHNRRVVVREGQQVNRGQVLAYSGSTGHTTGPHLHFEVRLNGRPLNPVRYLR